MRSMPIVISILFLFCKYQVLAENATFEENCLYFIDRYETFKQNYILVMVLSSYPCRKAINAAHGVFRVGDEYLKKKDSGDKAKKEACTNLVSILDNENGKLALDELKLVRNLRSILLKPEDVLSCYLLVLCLIGLILTIFILKRRIDKILSAHLLLSECL